MSKNLYITADAVGTETGGGAVTKNEVEAFARVGSYGVCERGWLEMIHKNDPLKFPDPWHWDQYVLRELKKQDDEGKKPYDLAHLYAGTFTDTVKFLKSRGTKVTYTAAAHSIHESKKAHEDLGIPFNYPHLTDPEQWRQYVTGYLLSDLVICPSRHSADCMRGYGCKNVKIIPHGHTPPDGTAGPPERFIVGYLGAYGPDKGVRYLLEAWRRLNLQDATLLLGGRDSTSHYVQEMASHFCGDKVQLMADVDDVTSPTRLNSIRIQSDACGPIVLGGWFNSVSDFYNMISLYVQPSVTEGFGIEVLEAMAHGRPVVCSTGAGAVDLVADMGGGFTVYNRDDKYADRLADTIGLCKQRSDLWGYWSESCKEAAEEFTWDKVQKQYVEAWTQLMSSSRS